MAEQKSAGTGKISQVIGAVVDVQFDGELHVNNSADNLANLARSC